MKKKIEKKLQMLDTLPAPDKNKILSACPIVPAAQKTTPVRRRFGTRHLVALSMAALLAIGGGVGVAAAEAKAYNEAIDFFQQYNLSAEGFTRSEVKKIYKDIVTESFTYEKTEEALASGLEGYEIQAQPLDSEGLKRVWLVGYWLGANQYHIPMTDQYEYTLVREDWEDPYELQQIKDGKVQWTVKPSDIGISEVEKIGEKAVVAGHTPWDPEINREYTIRLGLINEDSTQAWVKQYQCPYPEPQIVDLLCEDDEIILFVTQWSTSVFPNDTYWVLTVDLEGNRINEETIQYFYGFNGFSEAVRVGDSYLMNSRDHGLVRTNGNQIEMLKEFGDDDWEYQFTGMVKFNGLVYLTGTKMPRYHNRPEGNAYDNFVKENAKDGSISDEAVEEFYMNNHAAVLMICDPKTGEPQSFYTIPGASGGNLYVDGDRLNWEVNRYSEIESIYMENYYLTSMILAEISADKWQYVFTPYGQLVGEKDTGASIKFEG